MTTAMLKTAADQIESLVTELEASQAKVAALETQLGHAKTAAASDVKVAEETKAAIADKAKTAAAKLREVGLLSTDERRDSMATKLAADASAALDLLVKCAELVRVPKIGSVVVDNTAPVESADSAWDRRVASGSSKR